MSLRLRLVAALVFVGIASAALVGGIAEWLLMRDFRQSIETRSFTHFREDVVAYLETYGSWEAGERTQPFPEFVRERRFGDERPPPPGPPLRGLHHAEQAPFRFLLADAQGRVFRPVDGYRPGEALDAELRARALPVEVGGRVALLAVPIGEPNLSRQDRQYLDATHDALVAGLGAAVLLALAVGSLLASRLTRPLRELTKAIHAMRPDGELEHAVPVRSTDELGELAAAFNTMSGHLSVAHAQMQESHARVQAQARELHELSLRDALTGLYNRRHFDEQAATLFRQAARHQRPFSVAVLDLDHFKRINDEFSHPVGDQVLREFAQLLCRHTRASDVVARFGGEEFVMAFSESTLAQTVARCEDLRGLVAAHPWQRIQPGLAVTVSIGVCAQTALGDVAAMLAEADRHLYEAKHSGRDAVRPAPATQRALSGLAAA